MSYIEIRSLHKTFKGREDVVAIDDVSFAVEEGEMLVLLGPSGCGKTTTLRCIAGLERPDSGEVIIGGQTLFSDRQKVFVPPERRGLGMVFQSYAIWPHMRVRENLAYPLENRRVSAEERNHRIQESLELVGLSGLEDRYPSQLSGGQQQRVAFARAVIGHPKALLFDEPLSNLDAKLRVQMRTELMLLQHRLEFTGVYVTHDQVEALVVASRIVVMNHGKIEQIGTPREIYHKPATPFVANFVGHTNMIKGRLCKQSSGTFYVSVPWGNIYVNDAEHVGSDQDVFLAVRAELVRLFTEEPPADMPNCWESTVNAVGFLGRRMQYVVSVNGTQSDVRVDTSFGHDLELSEGQRVWVHLPLQDCLVFPLDGLAYEANSLMNE